MTKTMTIFSGLLAILLLFLISGCADDPVQSEPPPPPPTLIGTWEWLNTTGPDTYQTPQSEGYRLTLIFNDDSTFVEYKDSSIIYQGAFSVGNRVYWQQEWMSLLELEGFLSRKAFTFHTRDTLILSDYYPSNSLVARYVLDD